MTEKIVFFSQALFNIDKPTGGTKRYLELLQGFSNMSKDLRIISLSVVNLGFSGIDEVLLEKSKNPIIFLFKNFKKLWKYRNDKVICFEFYTSLPLILLGYSNVVTFVRQNYILCKKLEFRSQSLIQNAINSFKIALLTKLEDFILSRSKLIITQNSVDRNELIGRNPSINAKTIVIQNNINPSWLKNRTLTTELSGKLRLGFAGKLKDPRKGGDLILSAFKELDSDQACLIVAGDNTSVNANNVIDMGYQRDITNFLGKIDLLVVPSYTDSFPNIIIEAINFGIPVIGSKVGGIPELLYYDVLLFETNTASLLSKLKYFTLKENLIMAKQLALKRKEVLTFDWPKRVYDLISSEININE